jgi:hypothetical protein
MSIIVYRLQTRMVIVIYKKFFLNENKQIRTFDKIYDLWLFLYQQTGRS